MRTGNHIKKLIAGVLIAMLVISTAWADTYIHEFFRYTVEDDSVTITRYTGKEEVVTVPAMIGGHPVNTIAKGAFIDTPVRTIKLPDTIMTIEEGAFAEGQTVVFNYNLEPAGTQTQPDSGPAPDEQAGTQQPAPDEQSGTQDPIAQTPGEAQQGGQNTEAEAPDSPQVGSSGPKDEPVDLIAPPVDVATVGDGESEDGDVAIAITSASSGAVNITGNEDDLKNLSKDREDPTPASQSKPLKTILLVAAAVIVVAAVAVVFAKKGRGKA